MPLKIKIAKNKNSLNSLEAVIHQQQRKGYAALPQYINSNLRI